MTHSLATVEAALQMHADGANPLQISKALGVSRASVRDWIANPERRRERLAVAASHTRDTCNLIADVPPREYAYLFGQYLGDGCLSEMTKSVFRLRIVTCDDYPAIRERTMRAVAAVMPSNKVSITKSSGCAEVNSYSKHWPCLIPQHGPGRKHERKIDFEEWQFRILEVYPHEFLTGLIHSDGCRAINRVKRNGKVYEYPRYFFSNVSADILNVFTATCESIGVSWNQNRWNSISIARAQDVAYLDQFIGPKT